MSGPPKAPTDGVVELKDDVVKYHFLLQRVNMPFYTNSNYEQEGAYQ